MQLKHLHWLNWLTLFTLFILALVFYKERTCTLDAAYQVGNIFINNGLAIQINRFGAAFVQAFPLFSMRMGFPLHISLMLYSVAFVVEAIVVYSILSRFLQQKGLGTALIIYLTVMVGHTFYWTQSELLQACVLSFLFAGMLLYRTPKMPWGQWLLVIILEGVILFLHPLGFIPLLFFWGFTLLEYAFKLPRRFYATLIIGLAVTAYKHLAMPLAHYDKVSMGHSNGLLEKILRFFELESTHDFWQYLQHDYFLIIPVFVLAVAYYTVKKKWLKGLLTFFAFTCTLLLINASYDWGTMQFHVESFYRILVVFPATAIGWDMLKDSKWQKYLFIILPIVFCIRVNKIYHTHHDYTKRLDYYRELVASTRHILGDKFYIDPNQSLQPVPRNSWSSAMETLLLTAIETPDSMRSILITSYKNDLLKKLKGQQSLFSAGYDTISIHLLGTDYFPLSDAPYRRLQQNELKIN